MPYIFLLTLSSVLFLAGCLGSPVAVEHKKLSAYKGVEEACKQTPPKILHQECTQLLQDLNKERQLLNAMHDIQEDEKQEADYVTLADKEALLILKIHADKGLLAMECQAQMDTIVKEDDINSAVFCLLFDENSITHKEYEYLKKYSPQFDRNLQFITYEKQYAQKKVKEGLKAMNSGNKKAALDAFKIASSAKSAEAAYLVGIIYEEKQIKKAITWHKKALSEGAKLSKLNLARLYLRIKLPNKARAWYLSAAKDGNALAQYRLFKIDAKSKSSKAREEAQVWLDRSANNNYPQAQYIYGLQLLKQKKNEEALGWLTKANKNGVSDTNFFVGKIYFEQELYDKAYPHLLKAKENGDADYMLAQMYEKGLYVKKNSVLAYRHYKKAHEEAHDNHVSDMKRLQKQLTKKERLAAKYVGKKETEKAKKRVKSCGQIANSKNVSIENRTINIIGVAVKPIKIPNGFIIYGDNEKLYYIIDSNMAEKLKAFEYVNIKAKATGKAITISSDAGTLQSIYQFHIKALCK